MGVKGGAADAAQGADREVPPFMSSGVSLFCGRAPRFGHLLTDFMDALFVERRAARTTSRGRYRRAMPILQ